MDEGFIMDEHHFPRLNQLQIKSERSETENWQEQSVIQLPRNPGKPMRTKNRRPLLGTISTDQGQVDSEQQEVASKAIDDETRIEQQDPTSAILGNISENWLEQCVRQPPRNPGVKPMRTKNRRRRLGTISADQGQVASEQQEVASKAINDETHIEQQDPTSTILGNTSENLHEQSVIQQLRKPGLKEGLGRPIIKARLCRFTFPSLTVFLTMEDLEFIIPRNGSILKIEDISYDHESPGAKAQQHSAESYQPLRVVDDTDLSSKKDWIERSSVWNLTDNVIRSQLKSEKGALSIHICGISGKGCGAILRDYRYFPVVARSRRLSGADDTMSTFYSRLNGVALGVRIALDFELSRFSIHVPSFNLCNFMRHMWDPNGKRKSNQIGKRQVAALLRPEAMCDLEDICSLINAIVIDLDKVRRKGITVFHMEPVLSIYNQAAAFLANLSSDNDTDNENEMKSADILKNEQLSEILYDDAVR